MLRKKFLETVLHHQADIAKAETLESEIATLYRHPSRHYHTLKHLDAVLKELVPHREAFVNFDTVIFAIAYHDAVYNPLKQDNEEKSAALAVKRLTEIGFPETEIERCKHFILATKKHEIADAETNLFTDADLSILGADPETYKQYTQQIRREYSVYPDFLYNPGRRKVLQHFLDMKSIFKTQPFFERCEARAKDNLKAELKSLS